MIVASLALLLAAAGLLWMALLLQRRMARLQARYAAFVTCQGEARSLADARTRLRQSQVCMHEAFDSGTTGLELAHRALATYFGGSDAATGERAYAWARKANHNTRQVLTAWLAPQTTPGAQPKRRRHEDDG